MKITIGSFLIDRLISLGISRICGVPGDYNLEFLKLLAVYEIGWMLQICWREKRPAQAIGQPVHVNRRPAAAIKNAPAAVFPMNNQRASI
jgi:hypothetical protein